MLPVLLLLLTLRAVGAGAQFTTRPWLPWRTVETEHFAFHYPLELERWTLDLASHVESIDSSVRRVVGYTPARKTNVVVDNPFDVANGMAFPFLDQPVIELWATPPDPREDIGEFRGWGETLISHEFTHIAHLSRPSRNARARLLSALLPLHVGPISLAAPRWVIEGYATYSEGKVTGSGRPHGAWRPAYLRQWALEGVLPRYDQLDHFGGFEGGEFVYLAGSAFLEWLAQRNGDSSLVYLWRRMTARQVRSFDDAFTGVFGESPRVLYSRFTADVTGQALDIQRTVRARFPADTGDIVQRLSWLTGDPSFSNDGKRVALVVRSPLRPSRVIVWSTSPEPDTGRARRDSILLAHDSLDVPARSIYPPPKRVVASLQATAGAPYETPRFLRDGRILLWRETPVGDGTTRPDLYLWDPRRKSVHRVTHRAGVRNADPSPDGRRAVAERCVHGWCDVVLVDLETGRDSVVMSGDPAHSFYRPRFSPDGARILVSMSSGARWMMLVADTAFCSTTTVPVGGNVYDGTWTGAHSLVATSDVDGIPNLFSIDMDSAAVRAITHVTGAAVAAARSPADGSIWFLSLYSRGFDLRRVVPRGVADTLTVATEPRLSPAARTPPVAAPALGVNHVSTPLPYGLGRRITHWFPSGVADADGASAVVALTNIDVIDRAELIAKAGAGDRAGWRGVAVDGAWNGSRPSLRGELYDAHSLDVRLSGALAGLEALSQFDTWSARYRLLGAASRVRADTAAWSSRSLLIGDVSSFLVQRGTGRSTWETLLANATVGRSFDQRFVRAVASLSLNASGWLPLPVSALVQYGRTSQDAPRFERMTIGGSVSPLVDRTLLTQRLAMPVLPLGVARGTSALTYKTTLNTAPLNLYWWAGSAAPAGSRFTVWNRVIGAETSTAVGSVPAVGTPSARGVIGVGESLDAPLRHRLRLYASLVLNP